MENIYSRIETLSSKLHYRANCLATPAVEGDELYQHMVTTMIEKSADSPQFVEQTDAYLVQFAVWSAKKKLDAERTYTKYIGEDGIVTADDDGDEITMIELYSANTTTPEDAMIADEVDGKLMDVVNTLSIENRKIVKMLYCGYSKSEIAAESKISKPAVTQRLATIAKCFNLCLAGD